MVNWISGNLIHFLAGSIDVPLPFHSSPEAKIVGSPIFELHTCKVEFEATAAGTAI